MWLGAWFCFHDWHVNIERVEREGVFNISLEIDSKYAVGEENYLELCQKNPNVLMRWISACSFNEQVVFQAEFYRFESGDNSLDHQV